MKNQANASVVKEKLEQLKKAFEEFVRAHTAYHDVLENACDIDESDEYFRAIEKNNKRLASEISCWVVVSKETDFDLPADTNLREVADDVSPSDSISNVGSRAVSKHSRRSKSRSTCSKESAGSSVLSAQAKAAARRAILQAEATSLEKRQALQKEELALQMRKKALELQTEIAKAQAEELAYTQVEGRIENPATERNNTDVVPKVDSQIGHDANPITANQPASPSTEVKSEPLARGTFDNDATRNDALTWQLVQAQLLQNRQLQTLIERQQESTSALALPQPSVPVFGGNPIDYWTFIREFENLIEKKTNSHSARLYYLVQYTSGEVQELADSCLSMKEETGYQKARELLQKVYGSSFKIASAYVEKLSTGPAIKAQDGEAM